ncbi:MAG: DUF3531 family protein [Cyanothece sp. SIO2G6]|nr:DUF3531 family protein [Cyanothece sp. SIO2G6]
MQVEFRECDFFDLWIWVELETVPSQMEQQYLEEVFSSWFFLGKLGGFNAENLQVQETGLEISYMDYEMDVVDNVMMSVMHNMSAVEYEGMWARCWFDLGTTDALALDVLVNAIAQLNQDFVAIRSLKIGGENPDWPIPGDHRSSFYEQDYDA